jgi:iron complex transport system ATP-binding protein
MISNNNILTTSNLSIGYTSKATTTIIAENLNLNLQAGKLIALIGANGMGNQPCFEQ